MEASQSLIKLFFSLILLYILSFYNTACLSVNSFEHHVQEEENLNEVSEIRMLRLELFKQQLLEKLFLPRVPNITLFTTPRTIPAPMRRDFTKNNFLSKKKRLREQPRSTEILVFATKGQFYIKNILAQQSN